MSVISGPRTNPTVKSLATTNQRTLRSWQLQLGPLHMVILAGIVTGCMACAFYLGFFSGQRVGFEAAFSSNLSSVMRIPVSGEEESADVSADARREVYESLASNTADLQDGQDPAGKQQVAHVVAQALESADKIARVEQKVIERILESHAADGPAAGSSAAGSAALENAARPREEQIVREGQSEFSRGRAEIGSLVKTEAESSDSRAAALPRPKEPAKVRILGGEDDEPAPVSADSSSAPKLENSRQEFLRSPQEKGTLGSLSVSREDSSLSQSKSNPATSTTALSLGMGSDNSRPQQEPLRESTEKQKIIAPGWYAQVAAPDNRKDADALTAQLRASGFAVRIESANVRGQSYFRVLVGPEGNKTQAERLLAQLKREKGLKGEPFIRMIR